MKMSAEVLNVQVKKEMTDSITEHDDENAPDIAQIVADKENIGGTNISENDESSGVGSSEDKNGDKSEMPITVVSPDGNTAEQLQRMIQQQYLVNLLQFQQSMLQVCCNFLIFVFLGIHEHPSDVGDLS
jgi:hypothetical protein